MDDENENNIKSSHEITVDASVPWVELYRPTSLNDIVLDPYNRQLFDNILRTEYFPYLLLYGPPGTGKTSLIMNLINQYQKQTTGRINKSMVIHLNASDERGIDIIRNQINQFVRSKNLFETGMKFVILDEVDYMTKNAQQALKSLLQTAMPNVRFCLICNYISKIDESLQNEFIRVRFNQLPISDIDGFLMHIAHKENMNMSRQSIAALQEMYQSDIRSMINFMQLNQSMPATEWEKKVLSMTDFDAIYECITTDNGKRLARVMHELGQKCNLDQRSVMFAFLMYRIRCRVQSCETTGVAHDPSLATFLKTIEPIIHMADIPIDILLMYLKCKFQKNII